MKTFIKVAFIASLGFSLFSCNNDDQVEPDEFLNIPYFSSTRDVHAFPDPPSVVKRNILVEDFTGHQCGNCPKAAKEISMLQTSSPYDEQLIAVAIHGDGGFFNEFTPGADKYFYDFTTPEGIELDQNFGLSSSGLPKGMVNRKAYNGSKKLAYADWKLAADVDINSTPVAWVDVYGAVEPSNTDNITLDIRVKFLSSYTNPVKLNVVLVESGIINYQKDYTPGLPSSDISNYEHNHVLRYNHTIPNRNLYGTWGIELDATSEGTDVIKRVTTTKENMDWVVNNLTAVAYIYDATTNEVLQVNQYHLHE